MGLLSNFLALKSERTTFCEEYTSVYDVALEGRWQAGRFPSLSVAKKMQQTWSAKENQSKHMFRRGVLSFRSVACIYNYLLFLLFGWLLATWVRICLGQFCLGLG